MKQKWGQYELIDQASIQKIIEVLDLQPEDTVLEIGPGTGVLTFPIKEKVKTIIAVEIDKYLCEVLRAKGIDVVNIDFLRMDLSKLPARIKIVSNLPYYITTPIVTKILEEEVSFKCMVFTMQKEVAERLTAGPGTKSYGAISVLVQYYTCPEIVAEVPRTCFRPIPNVDSCVVFFKKRRKINLDYPEDFLFRVVRQSFSTRRKMLRNTLKVFKGLDAVSIDLSRRAETLSLKEFCELAEELWPAYAGT